MKKAIRIKTIYIRNLYFPLICFLFVFSLVIFPKSSVTAALKGINLWFNVVFPSLFPFFVGADLLNRSGIIRAIGVLFEPVMRPLFNVPGCGSFAFIMGITSGYPVGAKLTAGMREENMISKAEAERLLAFTNNSGPLFIIGAISVGMFKLPELGLFFLACHILACISVGILLGLYKKERSVIRKNPKHSLLKRFKKELLNARPNTDFGTMLGTSIKDSMMTIITIGGFIIFFSVIISLLSDTGIMELISGILASILKPLGIEKGIVLSLTSGFFEITTGADIASRAANVPFIQKVTATSAIIGWAGLSVHAQVLSIISKTDINIKPYLMGKLLQSIFAAIYSYTAVKLLGINFNNAAPAFTPQDMANTSIWDSNPALLLESLNFSLIFLSICITLVLLERVIIVSFKAQR